MEQQMIDMWVIANSKYFKEDDLFRIKQAVKGGDSQMLDRISVLGFKDPTTALLLSVFLGGFGIDRFYVGDTLLGVLKLLTGGLCGLWWFVDLFLIGDAARSNNISKLRGRLR